MAEVNAAAWGLLAKPEPRTLKAELIANHKLTKKSW